MLYSVGTGDDPDRGKGEPMAEARIEQEAERTTAIRVGTETAQGVTVYLDAANADTEALVSVTAPTSGGTYRLRQFEDTPELRAAVRALVRVWDAEDEDGARQRYWDAVQAARA